MASCTFNLPLFLEPLLMSQYGDADTARIVEGCTVPRVTSLRANSLKVAPETVAQALEASGLDWQGVPWYTDAFVLDGSRREREVRELPLYEQGAIYLQSLSSMLPAMVLNPRSGADVLDMCAAPGGKTTQMAALSGGKARITACEMHVPRAEKLQFNLERQGATMVHVMRADARRLDDLFSFDQILLDAPCSGTGTLRAGDPKMAQRCTPALVEKSVKAQKALLTKALRLLKPGGSLVYSTCSVLGCENEEVVEACLRQAGRCGSYRVVPVAVEGTDGELPVLPCRLDGALVVCPTDRYEGFFVAKIVRDA